MQTRRDFLINSGSLAIGSMILPSCVASGSKINNPGIQLYTVRNEMLADATGTLKQLAALGIKQIESAGSAKGNYYGLTPTEMKDTCKSLGITLRSGHIHFDDKWEQTMNEAVASGQEYLICSSMPTQGQTVENYKKVSKQFNKAGEQCKKLNIKFGYHNHDSEFEKDNGKILYDVMLEETDPEFVCMEMDLGWVIVAGFNPLEYFSKHPGRFKLWHLKDMDIAKKHSTEFGKGGLHIQQMFDNAKQSGMEYFFMEQEEYTSTAMESMQENMAYLKKIKG